MKPTPKIIPRANKINILPLINATVLVLNPIIRSIPSAISSIVAIHPAIGTSKSGINGVKTAT
ncbi:hypothetical protein D3C80_1987460 [compost metagenome]